MYVWQAASGAGQAAMDELEQQTREVLEGKPPTTNIFPMQVGPESSGQHLSCYHTLEGPDSELGSCSSFCAAAGLANWGVGARVGKKQDGGGQAQCHCKGKEQLHLSTLVLALCSAAMLSVFPLPSCAACLGASPAGLTCQGYRLRYIFCRALIALC